jgi:AcrR family transcriptional regulator
VPARTPARTGDRRDAVLEAALRLFAERGVDATTMEEVRRAVGMSNGSLFHHFPTKDHLLATLYLRVLGEYQALLRDVIDRHVEVEPGVRALVVAHVEWVTRHPDRARLLHEGRRAAAVDAVEHELADANRRLFERLRAWLRPHVEAGRVRDVPLEVFAALVLGPAMELTRAWIRRPDRARAARVTAVLADAAWCSVRAPGRPPARAPARRRQEPT